MIPCSNAVVSLWTMLYSKLACRTQGGLGMMTCSTAMVALETLLSVKPVFILSSCSANPINICGYRITKTCLNSWSSLNVVKTHTYLCLRGACMRYFPVIIYTMKSMKPYVVKTARCETAGISRSIFSQNKMPNVRQNHA